MLKTGLKYAVLFVVVVSFMLLSGVSFAANDDESAPLNISSTAPTRGQVLCTAAVNSNGTIPGCFSCNRNISSRLGVGTYQVGFGGICENITAARGWSRWLQVDTLTFGSIFGVSCTTADRAGVPNAVFVQCVNHAGALTDTSFFLFVAR